MSEKTEVDASEGEKQAENDTNQSLDVRNRRKVRKSSWKKMLR